VKAKKGVNVLPEETLKGLWCALDADDSNQIMPQELNKFLKRAGEFKSSAPKNLNKKKIELGGRQNDGLGRALQCTPTAELRASLDAALSDEELLRLSKQMNAALKDSLHKQNVNAHSWYNLFKDLDEDGSGFITFDEFKDVIRHKLNLTASVMSDGVVKGMWCALDVDDSNQVLPDEMSQFLKHGKVERAKKVEVKVGKTKDLAQSAAPTAEMRAKLEAPLSEDELDELSKKVTGWLEESLHKQNLSMHSWFNLFRDADEDGSGFISFDELVDVFRHKLKRGPSHLSNDKLTALWCALDADDSNQIMPNEFGSFLKRTPHVFKSKGPSNLNVSKIELGSTADLGKGRAEECTPTAEMRAQLEAELSQPQLVDLSKQVNRWLEKSMHDQNRDTHGWYNLFKDLDHDGSGFITFDEFEAVIRHKLKQPKSSISDATVRQLWCALDADNSNQMQPAEFAKFLKLGALEHKAKARVLHKTELGSTKEVGMGRALGCTPTKELRAELLGKGVAALGEDGLNRLSKRFNDELERSAYNKNKNTHSWFQLYNEVDKDQSGMITYDEFTDVARKHLKMKKKDLPEETLKGLWCALDADDSNQLQRDEFAAFLKRSAPAIHKNVNKKDTAKTSTFGAHIAGGALMCMPTREMRRQLKAPPLTEDELLALSETFHERLEASLYKQSKVAHGIGNLFADVDADGSGFVTFDEFEEAVRKKLQLKKPRLADDRLRALWCAIDADDSNQIHVNEFSLFVKGHIQELLDAARSRPAGVHVPSRHPKQSLAEYRQSTQAKPLVQLAQGTEVERALYLQFLNERAQERAKAHAQHEADLHMRLQLKKEALAAEAEARTKRRAITLQKAEYKRRMLVDMQMQLLRSPIPEGHARWDAAQGYRLGGGRVMPLYESERLLARLEKKGQVQWPGRAWSPRQPSTPLVGDVSRLENLLSSPSISRRSMSRGPTPMAFGRAADGLGGMGDVDRIDSGRVGSRASRSRGATPQQPMLALGALDGGAWAVQSTEASRKASRLTTPMPPPGQMKTGEVQVSSVSRPMRGSASLPVLPGGARQAKASS